MNPAAMKMKSRFGVAADWPVSYAELEPLYLEVERLLGVAGPADSGDRWRSAPYPLAGAPALARVAPAGARRRGAEDRLAGEPARRAFGGLRRPAGVQLLRRLHPRLPAPRQGLGRRHLHRQGAGERPLRDPAGAHFAAHRRRRRQAGRGGRDRRHGQARAAHRDAAPGARLRRGRDAARAAAAARPRRRAGGPQLPRKRRLDQHRRCRRAVAELRRPAGRRDQLGQEPPGRDSRRDRRLSPQRRDPRGRHDGRDRPCAARRARLGPGAQGEDAPHGGQPDRRRRGRREPAARGLEDRPRSEGRRTPSAVRWHGSIPSSTR